jgi:hypothetical protein
MGHDRGLKFLDMDQIRKLEYGSGWEFWMWISIVVLVMDRDLRVGSDTIQDRSLEYGSG